MIEIISLHILKTGGMSFLEMLRAQYGPGGVYHYIEEDGRFVKWKRAFKLHTIPSRARVIHGHFIYKDVQHIAAKYHPKVIVWFRDPVERVISRYHFLMKRIADNPSHPKIAWRNDTLLEFAQRPSQVNVMHRFVDGIALEELYFFGFLERFDSDMAELARKLNWNYVQPVHVNSNAAYKSKHAAAIEPDVRRQIAAINYLDMELYQRALKLKEQSAV